MKKPILSFGFMLLMMSCKESFQSTEKPTSKRSTNLLSSFMAVQAIKREKAHQK